MQGVRLLSLRNSGKMDKLERPWCWRSQLCLFTFNQNVQKSESADGGIAK